METNIDLRSSTIDKGIDLIKDFVEKLFGSSLEETGLIFSDRIRLLRLKNQIKILSRTEEICKKNNISINQINLKTLVPLLEYSSLEEDETLQEKWSNLLVNIIDSEKKYESSIFPYILNQLTSNEVKVLETLSNDRLTSVNIGIISGIELSNLIRLGLIELDFVYKKMIRNKITYYKFRITDLGYEFVNCCTRK